MKEATVFLFFVFFADQKLFVSLSSGSEGRYEGDTSFCFCFFASLKLLVSLSSGSEGRYEGGNFFFFAGLKLFVSVFWQ